MEHYIIDKLFNFFYISTFGDVAILVCLIVTIIFLARYMIVTRENCVELSYIKDKLKKDNNSNKEEEK